MESILKSFFRETSRLNKNIKKGCKRGTPGHKILTYDVLALMP
jgi:hypothetical protein